ncbi:unnamed protein product [Acanthoscelides obtectus]|nr:unnamed protein product [Acanthoscelides obtectus]CAK1622911.1 hypothetical protein AOBTE_LOCUS1726 [Acanthoscelides obtectus]
MWSSDSKKIPEGPLQKAAPPEGKTILGIVSRLTKMATEQPCKDIKLLKNTKITVFVDEALPDILVVTYEFGVKIFKGVLLDSTKRNLPCGVPNLNPAFDIPAKTSKDDPLYSVNQRFAYTEPGAAKKPKVQISSKYKNTRMTVRLRPRQVLCSKCKGICNENSENVSRKRKFSDKPELSSPLPAQSAKRGLNAPVTRSTNVLAQVRKPPRDRGGGQQQQAGATAQSVVPYLTRLTGTVPQNTDVTEGTSRSADSSSSSKRQSTNSQPHHHHENGHDSDQSRSNNHSEDQSSDAADVTEREGGEEAEVAPPPPAKLKRMFRKKRSASSTEERWEEASR